MIRIRAVVTNAEVDAARLLFREYEASLDFSLCFQSFEEELASLPGVYAPPKGRLLLAWHDSELAGCIALKLIATDVCEMKRLYVRPPFRALKIGRMLAEELIEQARAIGYRAMRLDTVPSKMGAAVKLYRSLGFVETTPYYDNPLPEVLYMEMELTRSITS